MLYQAKGFSLAEHIYIHQNTFIYTAEHIYIHSMYLRVVGFLKKATGSSVATTHLYGKTIFNGGEFFLR